MDNKFRKHLKNIGHNLNPVVIVGEKGLADGLLSETERALDDHELIKVKLPAGPAPERKALAEQLAQTCEAQVVQNIGRIALLYKKNSDAKHSVVTAA